MQNMKGVDLSNLPSIYSKRKTRKCSSCKCLKPMDQFLPITVNKKTVIPKTCQYCRSRRNSYYWNFESKKPKSEVMNTSKSPSTFESIPIPIGYIEKPKQIDENTSIYENTYPDVELPSSLPTTPTSMKRKYEEPVLSQDNSLNSPLSLSPLDNEYQFQEDELGSIHEFGMLNRASSIDSIPEDMNDIIVELQRQTVHSMMNELMNIGDILAASQLDIFNNQDISNDLSLADIPLPNEI